VHLKSLKLQRFRSCEDVTVNLQPDLTVLLGENNGGKSNIVDAIRLLTQPLSGRRERYPEDEDIRRNSSKPDFGIEGHFSGLSNTLKGLLISALPDPTEDVAVFGLRYQEKSLANPRGKTTSWAGKFDSVEPERGSKDLVRHVYLPPLRDAQQALGSGSAAKITSLLQHFLAKEDEEEFLTHVRRQGKPHRVIEKINEEISGALGNLTAGLRKQDASLDFYAEKLSDVARDLRFKLADAGLELDEIRSSGMGYANLLYMATVIVELTRAGDADLTLFLVEEPEAHLHPQLQMLVLQFLLDRAGRSAEGKRTPGQPEGRIQIIATTHSPNLTAWVSPRHLVVVRSQADLSRAPRIHKTAVVPIAELGLSASTLRKIHRYLDVTRSALLFGNRTLLVEGIAESLLIPVIAEKIVLKNQREAWLRFRGAVLIHIDGVDFKPYVEVLLRQFNGAHISDRVIVVTDADPDVNGNRKEDLLELATSLSAAGDLEVITNQRTLEYDLVTERNIKLLKNAFLKLYPKSAKDWREKIDPAHDEDRGDAFIKLLKQKSVRKGDLAQQIAMRIAKGAAFEVPKYLQDAIEKISAP
jgi:putative ATP-dependent endonuclease of OLD family